MKFFKFRESTDPKVNGRVYPQAECVYTDTIENPDYVFNAFPNFEKVDREVMVPLAKLRRKSAKQTDLLSVTGYGIGLRLLISDKLKQILENSKQLGYQFLPSKLYSFTGEEQWTYWFTNSFIFFPEYLDYKRSELLVQTNQRAWERFYCDNYEEFERKKKLVAPANVVVDKFMIDESLPEYDLFAVNNVRTVITHCVSEQLKNEIEAAGCTGLEFEQL